jgi:hypothetical protein
VVEVVLLLFFRVLKPPGGGSSDIFGTSEVAEQSPRRVYTNHHLQSSVFGANGTTETPTRRGKPGNDSYSRLFGPIQSRPQSTSVNRMKSNIPFGVIDSGSDPQQSGNITAPKSGITVNGQQDTVSTPTGEICSTVCTQTLKAVLLVRAEFMLLWQNTVSCFSGH